MKKLIYAFAIVLVSLFIFTSCSEADILSDLEETESTNGGGNGSSDPIED